MLHTHVSGESSTQICPQGLLLTSPDSGGPRVSLRRGGSRDSPRRRDRGSLHVTTSVATSGGAVVRLPWRSEFWRSEFWRPGEWFGRGSPLGQGDGRLRKSGSGPGPYVVRALADQGGVRARAPALALQSARADLGR